MDRRKELGEFLQTRRARLQPEDVGLRTFGGPRRVPGLRREELAQLAGVSFDYYVRLEQGRCPNVSEAILAAVGRALHHLARPVATARRRAQVQRVRPGLQALLDTITHVPAFVMGRRLDVLAWNRLASALVMDFPAVPREQRNMVRFVFLDESAQQLYPDWEQVARETVAFLRLDAGEHTDDPELASLVGELSVKSDDFRVWWADHDVREKAHGQKRYNHPLVGEIVVAYETLRLPDDPDQALAIYTVEPGSLSAANLALLASLTATAVPDAREDVPR